MNPIRSHAAPDSAGRQPTPASTSSTTGRRRRKPRLSSVWMAIRRMHLYFGILLMPWALLYGISGYLFNHPTHFQDATLRAFGADVVQGTPLAAGLNATVTAEHVVQVLNERFGTAGVLKVDPAAAPRYESDFVFASGESTTQNIQLLLHRDGSGGTLRINAKPEPPKPGSRFDVRANEASSSGKERGPNPESEVRPNPTADKSRVNAQEEDLDPSRIPIHASSIELEALHASVATIAERLDPALASIPFKVTSIPELVIRVKDGESTWVCRYNSVKGSLTSQSLSELEKPLPGWRRFMTRLHTAHGYPLSINARWVWAIIVDIMAFVMVFWGISGLIMWWQIKRTRPLGTAALVISLTIAVAVGSGMLQSLR